MGKLPRQTGSEIKVLPFMFAKVFGGIMASIGFPAVVFITTRKANPSLSDILPYSLLGVAGVVIFYASSRALARRAGGNTGQARSRKDKIRMSIISWVVLMILAAVFLLFTFIITR